MSNFKTHTAVNLGVALPLALSGTYLFLSKRPQDLWTLGLALSYGTLFMSPDMDLANRIKLFSLRGLLTLPFRSYALFFRHRGLSHSLFFGTLTRVFWLGLHLLLVLSLLYRFEPTSNNLLAYYFSYRELFQFGLAGLLVADLSHLIMDGVVR